MHRPSQKLLAITLALFLMALASEAIARDHAGHGGHASNYHHGHGYPARGYSTYHLPVGYHTSYYRGSAYYHYGGAWYRPYGPRYVVVAPPYGIGISVLPPFYTTLWFGGSPYYYADRTYYRYRPERREYVVTEPPREETYAYPRDGQSEEQQATDRDDCHRWAVAKTGYDPTRPAGNVAETDMTRNHGNYRRAEGACLEARGYSVK